MGNFDTTKVAIKNVIKENNNQEITGNILQSVLINMLNNIGVGCIFGGVAIPTTKPESITGTNAPVYYIANKVGTYVNFGNIVVNENEFAFLINGNDKKWKKASVNIPIATTSTDGLITKKDKAYIETLKPWLRGSLGSFDSSEAFNNYLDGLSFDTLDSGQYVAYLGGVPLFVTFSVLYAKDKISVIWVEGSLLVTDNIISSNTGAGVTICYRYYKNDAWGVWKTIYDKVKDIPTAQTSVNGTTKNYIYSASSDEMHTALSGKIWTYTHDDGNLFLRFKHWGANNDTSESNYSQVMVANAWIGGNGVLRRDIYSRLDSFKLREENSTADAVNIVTPIFTTGGTRSFNISKATTAKAGVMSAKDKTNLDNLTAYARDLGNFDSEEQALEALKNIEISANSKIVHVHCTYANGAMSITMMQNVENDYTRQIIFNKSKVYQRAIYFTNSTRQEISYAEDWSFLFGDRLHWDSSKHKYLLSQFGDTFNSDYTDEIPLATSNNDGLMSTAQVEKIKSLENRIVALEAKIK